MNQWGNTGFNVNSRISGERSFGHYGDNYGTAMYNASYGVWNGINNRANVIGINSGYKLNAIGCNQLIQGYNISIGKMLSVNLYEGLRKTYNNGIEINSVSNSFLAPDGNMYIGMMNDITYPGEPNKAMWGTIWRAKMLFFGDSLSASEHAALAAATTAFQSALSRA